MTEIAVYEPPSAPLPARVGVPGTQDFDSWTAIASEVVKLANVIYDTPFVPDGLRSGPAVAAAILAGRELGLGPMTSLANVHVIKGKPALSAVLMRALVLAAGHYWRDVEVTDTRAVIEGRRRNEAEWTRVSFTADQAKQAGIALGGYPQDKLYARATSRLARRKFADVIAGMPYSAEELEDGGEADAGTVTEQASNGHVPEPKPRTARRASARVAKQEPDPTGTAAADRAATAPADPALPPLPGEDEPDPTGGPQPGTGSSPSASAGGEPAPGLVGIIQAHFKRLGVDDREERLAYTAILANVESVASTKDLTPEQASAVADTLSRCKDRERLIAVATAAEGGSDA